ncbi:MAG: single-stranded DNA-binding protein [Sphingobacteriales bacterium]|nr:single-stranded DNA-binding protein [Sphingobacteriales bacterium]OJW01223.1 MAG: single-stranded DNA-binding protein [Sphingobacteriales bacterium 44-61]
MELTGRITADAKLSTIKDGRQVVNFSVAVNDSYKPKGSEVAVKVATFFNCSYWINPGIAQYLTKGTLVECFGRISVNAWTNAEGEAKTSLNFHVNSIKLHGKGNTAGNAATKEPTPEAAAITEPIDDLPF